MVKRYASRFAAGTESYRDLSECFPDETDRGTEYVLASDYNDAIAALRLLYKEMELSGNLGSKDYGWPAAITASRAILDAQAVTGGKS